MRVLGVGVLAVAAVMGTGLSTQARTGDGGEGPRPGELVAAARRDGGKHGGGIRDHQVVSQTSTEVIGGTAQTVNRPSGTKVLGGGVQLPDPTSDSAVQGAHPSTAPHEQRLPPLLPEAGRWCTGQGPERPGGRQRVRAGT
jgi:hypothetical protein